MKELLEKVATLQQDKWRLEERVRGGERVRGDGRVRVVGG